jgi:hypothetical protein
MSATTLFGVTLTSISDRSISMTLRDKSEYVVSTNRRIMASLLPGPKKSCIDERTSVAKIVDETKSFSSQDIFISYYFLQIKKIINASQLLS